MTAPAAPLAWADLVRARRYFAGFDRVFSRNALSAGAALVAKTKMAAKIRPTMREMVIAACKSAAANAEGGPGSRKGISSQAIKKFLLETYGVDTSSASKNSQIRKALVAAVASGVLLQTKGAGASGSFRLAATTAKPKAKETVATVAAKPKKAVMKTTTTTKGKKSATPVKAAKVKETAAGKNVGKKAVSSKVVRKAPKARKSPKVTAPKKAKTAAAKK